MAQLALDRYDTSASLRLTKLALTIKPYFRPAAKLTARILRAQGQSESAARVLRNAGISPDIRDGASLLWGVILLETGELNRAERLLNRFLAYGEGTGAASGTDPILTVGVLSLCDALHLRRFYSL